MRRNLVLAGALVLSGLAVGQLRGQPLMDPSFEQWGQPQVVDFPMGWFWLPGTVYGLTPAGGFLKATGAEALEGNASLKVYAIDTPYAATFLDTTLNLVAHDTGQVCAVAMKASINGGPAYVIVALGKANATNDTFRYVGVGYTLVSSPGVITVPVPVLSGPFANYQDTGKLTGLYLMVMPLAPGASTVVDSAVLANCSPAVTVVDNAPVAFDFEQWAGSDVYQRPTHWDVLPPVPDLYGAPVVYALVPFLGNTYLSMTDQPSKVTAKPTTHAQTGTFATKLTYPVQFNAIYAASFIATPTLPWDVNNWGLIDSIAFYMAGDGNPATIGYIEFGFAKQGVPGDTVVEGLADPAGPGVYVRFVVDTLDLRDPDSFYLVFALLRVNTTPQPTDSMLYDEVIIYSSMPSTGLTKEIYPFMQANLYYRDGHLVLAEYPQGMNEARILLYDAKGRLVRDMRMRAPERAVRVDLPAGVYSWRVLFNGERKGGVAVGKVVVY